MENTAVFIDFMRNNLGVTTLIKIDVITKFVDIFGEFISVNDGDIDTFVKNTNSTNNNRPVAQRILIRNKITQGLKSMFFELKDRQRCNVLTESYLIS